MPGYRKTVNNIEEAVLDHYIVCKEFFKHVTKMVVDESAAYSLTKYTNKKGDKTLVKESDHRTMILELDINCNSDPKLVRNVFGISLRGRLFLVFFLFSAKNKTRRGQSEGLI